MNDTPPPSASRDVIGAVLGRVPSGLFILTAADGAGHETGMLASWVQQASFEPPMISVAVNRQRYLHDWLERMPLLALNLLGSSQKKLLGHFARGFEPGRSAFEGLDVSRGRSGLPVLNAALGWLEGRVASRQTAGDHILYLVEVVGAGAGNLLDSEEPWVHVRKNGFRY